MSTYLQRLVARHPEWLPLPADWATARIEGRVYYESVAPEIMTPRIHPTQPAHQNVLGAAAENAFSLESGLPHVGFLNHPRGDLGYDFVAAIGRVDVKGVASPPWYLGATDTTLAKQPGASFFAELYCPVDEDRCWLLGFATRGEMELGEHVADVLDPLGKYAGEPGHVDQPGRLVRVEWLHDARLFMTAVKAGAIARFWGCQSGCCEGVFATNPSPSCCGLAMVDV